jgi:hypothetical protein
MVVRKVKPFLSDFFVSGSADWYFLTRRIKDKRDNLTGYKCANQKIMI